jgi:hypothetical protein
MAAAVMVAGLVSPAQAAPALERTPPPTWMVRTDAAQRPMPSAQNGTGHGDPWSREPAEGIASTGGAGTRVTEQVYRHQLQPVLLGAASSMDRVLRIDPTA